MRWMMRMALTLVMAATVLAAAPEAPSNAPADAAALDQQMRALLLEREQILNEIAEQAKAAPASERTAIDQDYAATQVQYEIQLLELMVQYYELTGNTELRERAEENLAQILAPPATGTPEPASANRTAGSQRAGEGR